MRAPLVASGLLIATIAAAQPRPAQEPSGVGYTFIGQRPRVPPGTTADASVTAVSTVTVTTTGPRGPSAEGPTVTITNVAPTRAAPVAPSRGVVVVRPAAPTSDPDAGVDDPSIPTAGALYGGPLPGPSIAYMGVPVQTRLPPPAPPLAPGAVLPGHSLPGSTPAPPPGATPWIPWTTSGFQLGPSGSATSTSGYGFQMQAPPNPGTLRGTAR